MGAYLALTTVVVVVAVCHYGHITYSRPTGDGGLGGPGTNLPCSTANCGQEATTLTAVGALACRDCAAEFLDPPPHLRLHRAPGRPPR